MKKYYFLLLSLFIVNCLEAQSLPKLIPVQKDNKWGFTNRKLKFVIPPTFDAVVYPFTAYKLPRANTIDSMAFVKLGEEKFFINTKGVRVVNLPKGYDYGERTNAPIVETSIMDDEQEALYKKKSEAEFTTDATTGKKGLIDQNTDTVLVPPQYDNIRKIYTDDAPLSNLYCVGLNKNMALSIPKAL